MSWDVFLSYHGVDRARARRLRQELERLGQRVFFDEQSIVPGQMWQRALEEGLERAACCLVLLTSKAPERWVEAEVRLALTRAVNDASFRVVPVCVDGLRPESLKGFLGSFQAFHLPEDEARWSDAVPRLVEALRAQRDPGDTPGVEGSTCPFPGLLALDEARASYFFGREDELRETLAKLGPTSEGHRRWLQIEGPSGTGKSSFALAGLVAAIRHRGIEGLTVARWRVAVLRPGRHPLESLSGALASELGLDGEAVHERLASDADGAARRWVQSALPVGEGLLVVVDQLEEAWTLYEGASATRTAEVERFATVLAELMEADRPAYVVTTIRSEFIGRFSRVPALEARLNQQASRYFLAPMKAPALRRAIAWPAKLIGLRLEPGLEDRMVEDALHLPGPTDEPTDVGAARDRDARAVAPAESALPLVAHVLEALWKQRTRDGVLTNDAYTAMGEVGGALSRAADSVLATLGASGEAVARRLLLRLVHAGRGTPDTRRPALRSETLQAAGDPQGETVLTRLSGGRDPDAPPESHQPLRLLVVHRPAADGEDRVDLAHEALLRHWKTLRRWVDEHRRALERQEVVESAATEWSKTGRQTSMLPGGGLLVMYRGEDLNDADHSLFDSGLSSTARAWLHAARAEDEAARRAQAAAEEEKLRRAEELLAVRASAARRLKAAIAVTAALLVAASIAAVAAFSARADAEAQRALAERRLSQAVNVARSIVVTVNERLTPIAGAAQVRRDVVKLGEGLLRELGGPAAEDEDAERTAMVGHVDRGDLAAFHKRLATARGEYESALRIAIARAKRNPDDVDAQRNLSVSHEKLGGVAIASGDLKGAREHFEACLTIAAVQAMSDPTNAGWQRDLSISHDKLAGLASASGDLKGARKHVEKALAIWEKLAASDPTNVDWQRDLSVSHERIGSLAAASGDLKGAREHFEAAVTTREKLASVDPTNADRQRALSVSHDKVGDLASATGDLKGAREHFEGSLTIAQKLAASDPTNAAWTRDMSVSQDKLGDLASASGDLKGAREHFEAAVTTRERLASLDPTNAAWQRDLSVSHDKLGDVASATGDLKSAREHFEGSLTIAQKLASSDPTNEGSQADLFSSHQRLFLVSRASGDTAAAEVHAQALRQVLAVIEASEFLRGDARLPAMRHFVAKLPAK